MSLEPTSTPITTATLHDVGALDGMDPSTLRTLAQSLMERIAQDAKHSTHRESQLQSELQLRQAKIDALTVEMRLLRHLRLGAKTEGMDAAQVKLFEEANAQDLGCADPFAHASQ
jgi:transposase